MFSSEKKKNWAHQLIWIASDNCQQWSIVPGFAGDFYKLLFIYFPQETYKVSINSFYKLGGTEIQRAQAINALNLKTRKYNTREGCMTVTGNLHILLWLRELNLHDLERLCCVIFTLYTFIYFFSTFAFREQIPETYCSASMKAVAESLQRFKISVLIISVP